MKGYKIASERCCKCCAFCTQFQPYDGMNAFRPYPKRMDYYEIKTDSRGRCPIAHLNNIQAGHPKCGKYISAV